MNRLALAVLFSTDMINAELVFLVIISLIYCPTHNIMNRLPSVVWIPDHLTWFWGCASNGQIL